MATVEKFEDLEVWKTARQFTNEIYVVTRKIPFSKDYGLRDQVCRAAVSIMSNIAEGFESRTTAMFIDYLGRAKASAGEARSQLYVALDCGYVLDSEFKGLCDLVDKASRQINKLIKYLESYPQSQRKDNVQRLTF